MSSILATSPSPLPERRIPPLRLYFFAGPASDTVAVEGTQIKYTIPLHRVPEGEFRELARAGFREQCRSRTSALREQRDGRLTAAVLSNFITRILEEERK